MSTRVFTLGDRVRTKRIPTRAGLHFYQGVVMDVNEAKQLVRLHNADDWFPFDQVEPVPVIDPTVR
jgi:hypothetical protein